MLSEKNSRKRRIILIFVCVFLSDFLKVAKGGVLGTDHWCAPLYIASRDRDRACVFGSIDFARRWGPVLRSAKTPRGFFLLLLRTSSSRVLPPFPFLEILRSAAARDRARENTHI